MPPDVARVHPLLFEDMEVTEGMDLSDFEKAAACKLPPEELTVVPVPKTVIDLHAGCSRPPCAHLGLTNVGLHAPNMCLGKKECTLCPP